MDLGFNLAQSNRDLKDLTSRQIFGDTSGLLCKNDLIPCPNHIFVQCHYKDRTNNISKYVIFSALRFQSSTMNVSLSNVHAPGLGC